MATANINTSEHDYFTFAACFNTLADAAHKADPEAFTAAATCADMTPVSVLRGAAYLGSLLASVPDDEKDPMQHKLASLALSELTALAARIIEHQNDAACLELAREQRAKAA